MPENNSKFIQAETAPLSHLETDQRKRNVPDKRVFAVAASVVALGMLIYWLVLDNTSEPTISVATKTTQALNNTTPQQTRNDNSPAPFAATQRELMRTKAQEALASFVELQLELQDSMKVQEWGQTELDEAMALATEGDLHFSEERYPSSLEAYKHAAEKMASLLEDGNNRFNNSLTNTAKAIDNFDPTAANESLNLALTLKPMDAEAHALQTRVNNLPKVINLIRTAKNHELSGQFSEALDVYQEIRKIDPETNNLKALVDQATNERTNQQVATKIGQGFRALEQQKFEQARTAFNTALRLAPENPIALGGLEQLTKTHDLDTIKRLRQNAEANVQQEQWSDAVAAYQSILDMDANIQFAIDGKSTSLQHQQTTNLLTKITEQPNRLSSQSLYLQAGEIVAKANKLPHRGPILNELLEQTVHLLSLYKDPVSVILLSDNATDITLSNVGRLGAFKEKTLNLRPGLYTVRGSQNGCRDLYLSIEVLPGIQPLDLSCPERLGQ